MTGMKKGKVIAVCSTLIGLVAAYVLFVNLDVEPLFREEREPVTLKEAEENRGTDYTGAEAGDDIPRLSGKEAFETTLSPVFTAEPIDIVATGAYELKSWVKPYTQRRTRKGRAYGAPKKKPQFLQYKSPDGLFHNREDYLPFYLLKLPDESYILAQIPKRDADAIRRGEHVVLPIGRKALKGVPSTLRSLCETYDAPTGSVYYAFCDAWYEKHYTTMFLVRAAAAFVTLFAVAVVLILIGEKVFGVSEKQA